MIDKVSLIIVTIARKFPPIFGLFVFISSSSVYIFHPQTFHLGIDPVGMQQKWENGELGALWPKIMYYYYFITSFGGTWASSAWPQIVAVSLTLGFAFWKLLKLGVHPLLLTICCFVMSIYPPYVRFYLNTEKDTVATMACVILFVLMVELCLNREIITDRKFSIGLGLALFFTMEVRKNNLLIVILIAVILLIHFRKELKKLIPLGVAFVSCIAVLSIILALTPMKKTSVSAQDTVGPEAWAVSAVYGTDGTTIPEDLNQYFTSLGNDVVDISQKRSAQRWANIWNDRDAFMLSSDVARLGLHNPWTTSEAAELILNSVKLCFVSAKNLETCLSAFGEFAGSSWNPFAWQHDTFGQSTLHIISDSFKSAHGIIGFFKSIHFTFDYLMQRYILYNYAVQFWIFLAVAIFLLKKRSLLQVAPLSIPLASWFSLFCFAPVHQTRYYLTLIMIFPLFLICLWRQTGFFAKRSTSDN